MGLKQQLRDDVAEAMRLRQTNRRDTLRLLLAAIQQIEVDQQVDLDDDGVMGVLAKQAKLRKESIADAKAAGRRELVAQEASELEIIETYLPQPMSEDEIKSIALQVIEATGATTIKDMGAVMGQLMPQVKGRADGRVVSDVVRDLLTGD